MYGVSPQPSVLYLVERLLMVRCGGGASISTFRWAAFRWWSCCSSFACRDHNCAASLSRIAQELHLVGASLIIPAVIGMLDPRITMGREFLRLGKLPDYRTFRRIRSAYTSLCCLSDLDYSARREKWDRPEECKRNLATVNSKKAYHLVCWAICFLL